jgi:hypothetical protein
VGADGEGGFAADEESAGVNADGGDVGVGDEDAGIDLLCGGVVVIDASGGVGDDVMALASLLLRTNASFTWLVRTS